MSAQGFQSKALKQLERIKERMGNLKNRLSTIDRDVQQSDQCLDNLLGSLRTALVVTVTSVNLFISGRNVFEFWLANHPPLMSGS